MALNDHISAEDLAALDAKLTEEDAAAEASPEQPESERVVAGHQAFGDHGVEPREIGGVAYSDFE